MFGHKMHFVMLRLRTGLASVVMENLLPLQSGVHVNQDTRLDNRVIDVRVSESWWVHSEGMC